MFAPSSLRKTRRFVNFILKPRPNLESSGLHQPISDNAISGSTPSESSTSDSISSTSSSSRTAAQSLFDRDTSPVENTRTSTLTTPIYTELATMHEDPHFALVMSSIQEEPTLESVESDAQSLEECLQPCSSSIPRALRSTRNMKHKYISEYLDSIERDRDDDEEEFTSNISTVSMSRLMTNADMSKFMAKAEDHFQEGAEASLSDASLQPDDEQLLHTSTIDIMFSTTFDTSYTSRYHTAPSTFFDYLSNNSTMQYVHAGSGAVIDKIVQGRDAEPVHSDSIHEDGVDDITCHHVPFRYLHGDDDTYRTSLEPVPSLVLTLPTPEVPPTPTFVPQSPITVSKYVAAVGRIASSLASAPPKYSRVPSVPSCGFCSVADLEENVQCRACDKQWLACKVWYQATDGGRWQQLTEPYIIPAKSNASNRAIMDGVVSLGADPRGAGIAILPLPSRRTWYRKLGYFKSLLQEGPPDTGSLNALPRSELALSIPEMKELSGSSPSPLASSRASRLWAKAAVFLASGSRIFPPDNAQAPARTVISCNSDLSPDTQLLDARCAPPCNLQCVNTTSGTKFVELGLGDDGM